MKVRVVTTVPKNGIFQIDSRLHQKGIFTPARQVYFAGCRLQFNYNWKTAGTKNN